MINELLLYYVQLTKIGFKTLLNIILSFNPDIITNIITNGLNIKIQLL